MTLHVVDGAAQERAKYAEIWAMPEYRNAHSPGLENVDRFMSLLRPRSGQTIIDFGCGDGRAGLEFQKHGLVPTWFDLTLSALDPAVPIEQCVEGALWNFTGAPRADYGFCCDVLEHIPTEYAMLCIDNILKSCGIAWLQICNLPDEFGKLIGEPLHLTVKPFDWWKVRIATLGTIMDARDLCGASLFIVSKHLQEA